MTAVLEAPPAIVVEPLLFDPLLRMLASSVDDLEKVRKATQSRHRQVTRSVPDEDGVQRGLGLDVESPFVVSIQSLLEELAKSEKQAVRQLEKAMKQHPLGAWVASIPGVGLKQAARLLAAIGDPYWHLRQDRPRTVSELWAYAGYHTIPSTVGDPTAADAPSGNVAARRRKGVKSNWSSEAKTRAYLIAESCVKAIGSENRRRSPYRDVYDKRKAHVKATHPEWSDGHHHNDALRITAKTILKDLWIEARRLHEEATEELIPN